MTVSADSAIAVPTSMPPAPAAPQPVMTPQGAANDNNPRDRERLGRPPGELSTKIHLVADRRCRPITRLTSPGQHGDCPRFIPLMDTIGIQRGGRGQPPISTWPGLCPAQTISGSGMVARSPEPAPGGR